MSAIRGIAPRAALPEIEESVFPESNSVRVVLLTGGNLGDVAATLEAARRRLIQQIGPQRAASACYRSKAWGFESPEEFLNQVLVLETSLTAERVLERCQQIEREGGRVRGAQGGGYRSRTLDIDILFYGEELIQTPLLTVPHPLIAQREFVLRPLCEVLPEYEHPLLHRSIRELLQACLQRP